MRCSNCNRKKTQVGKKPSNKNYYNRRVAEIFIVIDDILQQHQRRNVFDLLSLCANVERAENKWQKEEKPLSFNVLIAACILLNQMRPFSCDMNRS